MKCMVYYLSHSRFDPLTLSNFWGGSAPLFKKWGGSSPPLPPPGSLPLMSQCIRTYIRSFNYNSAVPGVPELRIFSATDDSLSVSWTMPNGSKVDQFEIQWERFVGSTSASFRDTLSSKSNNYTVTGLKGYDNATFSVSVTAYNAAGSATSSNINVAANFASGNTKSEGENSSSSSGGNNEATIGGIVAGFVILAIAVVVVAILVYHYKSKSKKNKPNAVYS